MKRRAQATVQQLVLVAGVVVLASAVYFISRGLVSTTQVSLDVEQAKSFEIISQDLTERGELITGPSFWADTRFDYKSSVTLKNRHSRAIQDVVVLTGDYVGEGVKKGTVSVRYLDPETGKYVEVPLAEFSRSDGCEYTQEDLLAFQVELDPDEEKTYEIYGNSEYKLEDSCSDLRHENIYSYSQNKGETNARLAGKYGFYYVGEGTVTGSGRVSLGGEECDLAQSTYCGLSGSKVPTLVGLDATQTATIDETGNLVFVEGQVFEDDMALYFWVSGCRESFKIRIQNMDPVQKMLRILESDGSPAKSVSKEYGSYALGANEVSEDVLLISSPGVWSVDLPEGVAVTSEEISINFALDPDSLSRVVDSEGNLLLDSNWEYDEYGNLMTQCLRMTGFEEAKKRPDVSAPKFNKSFADHMFPAFYPPKPDSNDNVKIFVLAWDSNDNPDPSVKGSIRNCSAKMGNIVRPMVAVNYPGTGENPTRVANASFDTNTEVAAVALGTLKQGTHTVEVSCEDNYKNINTTEIIFNVSASREDTSAPEFRILDKVLNKRVKIEPGKKTSAVNLSFTVDVYDSANPIKNCWLSVYDEKTFLYREVEMSPVSGEYGEDVEIVANFTTQKPLEVGEYYVEVACEDTQAYSGTVVEEFLVVDGVAPTIDRVSFSVEQQSFGENLPQFLDPWTKIGFEVVASDDIEVKGCRVLYQTDPLRKLSDHEPKDLVCKAGCGTSSSVFGFENSDWPRGGDYKVRFVCEDAGGNEVKKDVLLSVVDATSPIVEDFSLSPGKPGNQDVLTFSANVSDDVAVTLCNLTLSNSSGVEKAHFVVLAGDPEMTPISEGDYSSVNVVLSVNKLADDEYGVNFTCDDESTDNIPNVLRRHFYVDTYGPLFFGLTLDKEKSNLSVRAYDPLSGVSDCSAALASGTGTTTMVLSENRGLFSSKVSLPSEFGLTIMCSDNYGRESHYAYKSISIPEIVFPKVSQGGQYNNNETLEFRVEPEVDSSGGPEIVVEECLCSLTHGVHGALLVDKVMSPGNAYVYEYENEEGFSNALEAEVSCRDSTGFSYTKTGSATVLDIVPPRVSKALVLDNGSLTDTNVVGFEVSVSDKGEGVKKCEAVVDPRGELGVDDFRYPMVPQRSFGGKNYLFYGGHDYSESNDPFKPEVMTAEAPGEYVLNSGPFYGGNYTVRVSCYDNAGLVAGSGGQDNLGVGNKTYFGIKDTTPPVVYAMTEGSQSVEVWMSNTTQWRDTDSITFRVLAVDEATDVKCFINMTDDAEGYGWSWATMKRGTAEDYYGFYLSKAAPGKLCLGRGHEIDLEGLVQQHMVDDDLGTAFTLTSTNASLKYAVLPVSTTVSGTLTKTSLVDSAYNLLLDYKTAYGCSNPIDCAESRTCGCPSSPSISNVYARRSDFSELENGLILLSSEAESATTTVGTVLMKGWLGVPMPMFGRIGEIEFGEYLKTYGLPGHNATYTFTQGGDPGIRELRAYHDPAYRRVVVRCTDNVRFGESNTQTVVREVNIERTPMHIASIAVGSKFLPYTLDLQTVTVTGATPVMMIATKREHISSCNLKVGGTTISDFFDSSRGANVTSLSGGGPPYLVTNVLTVTQFVPEDPASHDGNYTVTVKCDDDLVCGTYPSTWLLVDSTPPTLPDIGLTNVDLWPAPDVTTIGLSVSANSDHGSGIDYCLISYAFSGVDNFFQPLPWTKGTSVVDMSGGTGLFSYTYTLAGDTEAGAAAYVCFDKAGNMGAGISDYSLFCDPAKDPWSVLNTELSDYMIDLSGAWYFPTEQVFHMGIGLGVGISAGVITTVAVAAIGTAALSSWIPYAGWAIAAVALIIAAIAFVVSLNCVVTPT